MSTGAKRSGPDLAFGFAMLAVSLVLGWDAAKLRPSPFDPLGPGSLPKLVAGCLGLLSLILLARIALGRRIGRSETSLVFGIDGADAEHRRRPALALAAAAATVLYVALLSFAPAGFLWPTVGYLAALGFALSDRSRRAALTALAVAVLVGGAIALLFTRVLFVDLP